MRADSINNQLAGRLHQVKDTIFGTIARWLPRWMTPNVITILRIAFIPFMVLLYSAGYIAWAVVLFLISLCTDALDGIQARRLNMETTLGKLLDPAADKLLIITAFFITALDRVSALVFYTIVGLEFTLVLLAVVVGPLVQRYSSRRPKLGANNAGKIKMTLESVGVGLLLVTPSGQMINTAAEIILWLAALFALLSIMLHLFLREPQQPVQS